LVRYSFRVGIRTTFAVLLNCTRLSFEEPIKSLDDLLLSIVEDGRLREEALGSEIVLPRANGTTVVVNSF
jgi:hypothetical protein